MATEIKDIQKLIDQKAESALQKDIEKLDMLLYNENAELLDEVYINVGTPENPKNIQLKYIFSKGTAIHETIWKNNIDKYRNNEAKNFLAKVESLRTDVDNLLSNQGLQSIEELQY